MRYLRLPALRRRADAATGWGKRGARQSQPGGEDGSAVVGFALISGLLMVLVLGCLQLCLTLWVRTVLIDVAGEAARQAAMVNAPHQAAEDRVSELLASTVGSDYVTQVRTRTYHYASTAGSRGNQTVQLQAAESQIVEVTLEAPLPLLTWLGKGQIQVSGRAVLEEGPQ